MASRSLELRLSENPGFFSKLLIPPGSLFKRSLFLAKNLFNPETNLAEGPAVPEGA